MKIIIADEDIIVRKKLRKLLEILGQEVIDEAENGLHAYQKFIEFNPDIIILDISMPIYDGVSALIKIKKYNLNSCVIMLSEKDQKHETFEALTMGAEHFIKKPFEIEQIEKVLDDIKLMENRTE